mmetsp:Transcript_4557/g.13529  ORF Transcript_4557/g.13529 Transcript_4557/m.13529 type:complete len:228 (+) Transcript_4557:305-988(+)
MVASHSEPAVEGIVCWHGLDAHEDPRGLVNPPALHQCLERARQQGALAAVDVLALGHRSVEQRVVEPLVELDESAEPRQSLCSHRIKVQVPPRQGDGADAIPLVACTPASVREHRAHALDRHDTRASAAPPGPSCPRSQRAPKPRSSLLLLTSPELSVDVCRHQFDVRIVEHKRRGHCQANLPADQGRDLLRGEGINSVLVKGLFQSDGFPYELLDDLLHNDLVVLP